MTQRIAISDSEYEVPGKIAMEGASPVYVITVPGVSTITNDASLQMFAYKGSTDASSTFLTGSMSVSGNKITTKTFTGLIGKDRLRITVFATMDGVLDCVCAFWLRVQSKSGKM